MTPKVLKETALALSDFLDLLELYGFGPELAQKIVVRATPSIVQAVVFPYDGEGCIDA